jgi:hypothetical protein
MATVIERISIGTYLRKTKPFACMVEVLDLADTGVLVRDSKFDTDEYWIPINDLDKWTVVRYDKEQDAA